MPIFDHKSTILDQLIRTEISIVLTPHAQYFPHLLTKKLLAPGHRVSVDVAPSLVLLIYIEWLIFTGICVFSMPFGQQSYNITPDKIWSIKMFWLFQYMFKRHLYIDVVLNVP